MRGVIVLAALRCAWQAVPALSFVAPLCRSTSHRAAPRAARLSDEALGVGIIGCGRIGQVHLDTIAGCADASVKVVGDFFLETAERAAGAYGVPRAVKEASDVINDPEVDAVWVCSPSQFHAAQIKEAAAAGKHIFCEKPIATNLEETVEAVRFCDDKQVKLMTALQRRFDPTFDRIKTAIENDEVGTPIVVKLCSRDPAPPPFDYVKGGGGIFKDMAIHDLDMSRHLMGSEPTEVLALGSCHIDKAITELEEPAERYDTASILVKYENGKSAIIDVCRQAPYGYDQRAEVLGTKGMLQSENLYPNSVKKFTQDFTGNADLPFDFFMSRYKEAYRLETLSFIDSVFNDKPVTVTGYDGIMALAMAMAAGESAARSQWVKLAEVAPVLDELTFPR